MLKRCFRRTVRYGFFAPLQALYLSLKKTGRIYPPLARDL